MNREGYLPVPGGMVWFRVVGDGPGRPLLVLHGGPGAGSDYLDALTGLSDDRPVILYDQSGGGRSGTPRGRRWRMDHFVRELAAVRQQLGGEWIHLYGHSWGGWLALEYLLSHGTAGVRSVVLASTSASLAEQIGEMRHLRAAAPAEIAEALQRYEESGELDHHEYRAAVIEFYQRHLCRLSPWPSVLTDVVASMAGSPVYRELLGVNEMVVTGTLRDWDRSADLHRLDLPALVTVGRYDEITPHCAETLSKGLPQGRLKVFEQSSHMPHLEERAAYLDTLRQFLRLAEAPAAVSAPVEENP